MNQPEYQKIIDSIFEAVKELPIEGETAAYIPELQSVPIDKFGVYLKTVDHQIFSAGDAFETFSIQSIAKVFSLILVFKEVGESLWERVGVEPSGNPFNSLVQLEYDEGIPRNPFINAGALVICDILISLLEHPQKEFLDFINSVSELHHFEYCEEIALSEKATGYRNRALANLMKAFGNIHNEVDEVLDFYFKLCSIKMSCKDIVHAFGFLTLHGLHPQTNERILTQSQTKRILAIMQTCGFYDEAGEFSFKVGLPGKSGVGGGIVAILPNKYTISVWSPALNKKGNSIKGMLFLEQFTTKTKLSIF